MVEADGTTVDRPGERSWDLRAVVGVLAAVFLCALVATTVVVGWWYQPDVGWWTGDGTPVAVSIARWHGRLLAVGPAVLLLWLVVAVVTTRRTAAPASVRTWAVAGLAALSWAAVVLTSMTWGLVAWEQVALEAVTVGENVRGLWHVALMEGVAFVLVDGAEIGQATLARWVVVHLAAPLVALVTFGLSWWLSRPPRAEDEVPSGGGDVDGAAVPVFDLVPVDGP